MKKLTSLAIFLLTFLVACALPTLPALPGSKPILVVTLPPTKPSLTATPSATFSADFLTAQAITDAENIKLAATDSSFFSFCNDLAPEWGYSTGKHIQEIALDWVMLTCKSSDGAERSQKFVYKRGLKIWSIALSDASLFPVKDKYDVSLDMELISKSDKDVYLSPSYHLKDGTDDTWNPLTPLHYKTALYRLNLDKGNLDALLDPNKTPGDEFAYAISPDEAWMIFAKASEKNIFYVRNLLKGTDKKIALKDDTENIGDFVWSTDSRKVFFVAAPTGWRDNKAGTFIYAYDPFAGQVSVIVHSDSQQRMPFPVSNTSNSYWVEKNFLSLISAQNGLDQWKLDIRNGYIGPISTPTPKP